MSPEKDERVQNPENPGLIIRENPEPVSRPEKKEQVPTPEDKDSTQFEGDLSKILEKKERVASREKREQASREKEGGVRREKDGEANREKKGEANREKRE